ncbi:protein O-linked-mannose beta-1,2-N-acetylglucosaminyltransferase 1 [Pocillopora verrucosa]|uniref:protein O-linked-mannose beta-1,2-N-acetylglucosaminyltransferase 1 n=1 Tax=Pocillopora verrucosa TaxID=203993 RepID=UPI00279708E0|nr:protein O-linked-mannose beta-1,2-N-acetylglucosaminyltransferase 1-like [Pocillopora verrucosa]
MVVTRSTRRIFGKVIFWTLFVSTGVLIIFNMVFFLQTASELALLTSSEQDKTTLTSASNKGRTQGDELDLKEGNFLELAVLSSKENVTLTINGQSRWDTSEMLIRGLNVVVLNEVTGVVMSSRWFDTYESDADSGFLIEYLKGLRDGRIVCFAIKDEAIARLSEDAISFLSSYGSSFIKKLRFRSTWAFVVSVTKNQRIVHAESYQNPTDSNKWASPIKIRTLIKLKSEHVVQCQWEDTIANRRRMEFCGKFEGYGNVCRCENPVPLEIDPPAFPDGSRFKLPIAIMASNRPSYLLRMLLGMQKVHGLDTSMMTVFIDGFWPEPASITRLLGVNLEQHAGVSRRNARICQHYKKSIVDSFDKHPDASFLLILEEDLDVSVDILSYFKQLLPVYENDESVYCISAWNDQGYDHLCNDPAMTYRVDTMPGLGWVLSRKLFKNELEEKWPRPEDFVDWDIWMRGNHNRKGRECIIPDISRTYHFGGKGLNVGGHMQARYFAKHSLNTKPNVKLDVDKMYKENYEKEINQLLSKAKVLDHTETPCTRFRNFVPDTKGELYVFYIRMEETFDHKTWKNIATCLKMWDLDARGYHHGLWRFWVKKNHVIVVGCPASIYCSHKPKDLKPIYIPERVEPPEDEYDS